MIGWSESKKHKNLFNNLYKERKREKSYTIYKMSLWNIEKNENFWWFEINNKFKKRNNN